MNKIEVKKIHIAPESGWVSRWIDWNCKRTGKIQALTWCSNADHEDLVEAKYGGYVTRVDNKTNRKYLIPLCTECAEKENYTFYVDEAEMMPVGEQTVIIGENEVTEYKKIPLLFHGYYKSLDDIPEKAGVYCMYSVHKGKIKPSGAPLYIGESENIKERLSDHEKIDEIKKSLKDSEEICFSYAVTAERLSAEQALIYKVQSTYNTEYKDKYDGEAVSISISGEHEGMANMYVLPERK